MQIFLTLRPYERPFGAISPMQIWYFHAFVFGQDEFAIQCPMCSSDIDQIPLRPVQAGLGVDKAKHRAVQFRLAISFISFLV
jgi:hypothetical protein